MKRILCVAFLLLSVLTWQNRNRYFLDVPEKLVKIHGKMEEDRHYGGRRARFPDSSDGEIYFGSTVTDNIIIPPGIYTDDTFTNLVRNNIFSSNFSSSTAHITSPDYTSTTYTIQCTSSQSEGIN